MREGGGNYLKYLKREWDRKEGRRNKDFKKRGGESGSRGGCLKKGGGGHEPPYELCTFIKNKTLCKWQALLENESKTDDDYAA